MASNWMRRLIARAAGFDEESYVLSFGSNGDNAPMINDSSLPRSYEVCAWVYACVQSIASACGSVPIDVYEKTGRAEWIHDEKGEYDLTMLLDYANSDDDISSLIELTSGWLGLFGNSYWHLLRPSPNAKPVAIRCLPADKVEVIPGKGIRSGIVRGYRILTPERPELRDIDVVHFKSFSVDPYYGIPPIRPLTPIVNMWSSMTTYKYNLYKSGGVPSSILKLDKPMIDEDERARFRAMWASWRGPESSGMPLIIGSSMQYQAVGMDPDKLAAPTLSTEVRETICGVYGVPPSIVGLMDRVNYNTARTQRKTFWTETVQPKYMRRIVSAINEQMAPQFTDGTKRYHVQADYSQIEALQEDKREQADAAQIWINIGVKSPNDVREELGMPSREGGDVYVDPSARSAGPELPFDKPTEDSVKSLLEDILDERQGG